MRDRGMGVVPGRRVRPWLPIAFLLLAAAPTPARAQVSPGPLARAHQDLDSNLKCFNCHGQRGQGGAARRASSG